MAAPRSSKGHGGGPRVPHRLDDALRWPRLLLRGTRRCLAAYGPVTRHDEKGPVPSVHHPYPAPDELMGAQALEMRRRAAHDPMLDDLDSDVPGVLWDLAWHVTVGR